MKTLIITSSLVLYFIYELTSSSLFLEEKSLEVYSTSEAVRSFNDNLINFNTSYDYSLENFNKNKNLSGYEELKSSLIEEFSQDVEISEENLEILLKTLDISLEK
jgi:hypothetical protein